MGEIIYNGVSSRSFGLEVETFPAYQAPKRTYEKVHIPGRNGDLIIDKGCWENAQRAYLVALGSYDISYYEMMNKLSNWLHSTTTYARLEDSYEPDVYRLAVFLEEMSMTNIYNHGAELNLTFDCKPQRFLKSGEEPVLVTKGPRAFINPSQYPANPIIHVYGTGIGQLEVGDRVVEITSLTNEVVIDSELQDAYLGYENKNPTIKVSNGFPILKAGTTNITFSGNITKVEVIPRWYTL